MPQGSKAGVWSKGDNLHSLASNELINEVLHSNTTEAVYFEFNYFKTFFCENISFYISSQIWCNVVLPNARIKPKIYTLNINR